MQAVLARNRLQQVWNLHDVNLELVSCVSTCSFHVMILVPCLSALDIIALSLAPRDGTTAMNHPVPPLPSPISPSGYCHSIGLDCAAKVIDPDAVQMTTYGYAHAAGVLPGGAHMDDGPVAERLPHMMPAIGQYYFSMPWVVQVCVWQARGGGAYGGAEKGETLCNKCTRW